MILCEHFVHLDQNLTCDPRTILVVVVALWHAACQLRGICSTITRLLGVCMHSLYAFMLHVYLCM